MLKNQPQPEHLQQGNAAEKIAATFLQQKGLTLVEKNFRCKYGEIDLIMREGKTLVFVEVRLRSNEHQSRKTTKTQSHRRALLTDTRQLRLPL